MPQQPSELACAALYVGITATARRGTGGPASRAKEAADGGHHDPSHTGSKAVMHGWTRCWCQAGSLGLPILEAHEGPRTTKACRCALLCTTDVSMAHWMWLVTDIQIQFLGWRVLLWHHQIVSHQQSPLCTCCAVLRCLL